MKINYLIFFLIIIIFCIVIPKRNKLYLGIIKRKKKGVKRKMPQELMKEFIGKVCSISLLSFGITGKIISIEGNWIKILEKDTSRLVNGDMIRDIKIMPEKYQK